MILQAPCTQKSNILKVVSDTSSDTTCGMSFDGGVDLEPGHESAFTEPVCSEDNPASKSLISEIFDASGSMNMQMHEGVIGGRSEISCGMSFVNGECNADQYTVVPKAQFSSIDSPVLPGASIRESAVQSEESGLMLQQPPDLLGTVHHQLSASGGMSFGTDPHEKEEQATQRKKTVRIEEQIEARRFQAIKRRKIVDYLRPMQKEALEVIEKSEHHTIIIMPTGSGKTTLMWSFKPEGKCSLIFAPYRILVQQLSRVLTDKGTTFTFPLVSKEFDLFSVLATADFIIMPYEAAPTSADLVTALFRINRLGPIWVDEVHTLASTGRFRASLDSFWNLCAELQTRGVSHKMIGLTATLRPDDVSDIMRRMSIAGVDVYRQSCFRPGLNIKFPRPFRSDQGMIKEACALTSRLVKDGGKVLVLASTVNLSEIMRDQIQVVFHG